MAHPQLRSYFSKYMFLESAVKGKQFALMVSASYEIMKLCYVQYRTFLEKFQSKWSNFSATIQDGNSSNITGTSDKFRSSRWKGVNYAGPSKFGRTAENRSHNHGSSGSRETLACFNCGGNGCRVKTCKEPLNLQRVA